MQRLACIALGLAVLGCGPLVDTDGDTESASEADGSASGVGSSTTTAPPPTPTSVTTPVPPPPPGTSTSTTTTPQPTTVGTTTTPPTATDPTIGPQESSSGFATSSGGGTDGLPDGADCSQDSQCASDRCYVTGIGGLCGECSSDDDCEFGCTPPNMLGMPQQESFCNAGELGDGCEDSTACVGLQCVEIINLPGILMVSTCGECDIDADCMPGQLCDIDIDIPNLSGARACIAPVSLDLGDFCDLEGSGDQACMSGYCAEASLKGLLTFGICSECEVDDDCPMAQTCSEPALGLDGDVTPGVCV